MRSNLGLNTPYIVALAMSAALACAEASPSDVDGGTDPVDPTAPDASAASGDAGAPTPDGADAGTTTAACAAAIAQYRYDWATSDQGWSHRPMPAVDPPPVSWTFDHWQRGSATSGPGACGDGGCWATNLTGNYISCQRAYLVSPPMDLAACAGQTVQLQFRHSYEFWVGDWGGQTWSDGGLVELSTDGVTWQALDTEYSGTIRINPDMGPSFACVESTQFYVHNRAGFIGANSGWDHVVALLPDSAKTAGLRVRFTYASGVSGQTSSQTQSMMFTRPGWYIDDVAVVAP